MAVGVAAGLARRCIGSKLMAAFPAEIFLETGFIFAITIKRMIVVAFWTVGLVYFNHEYPSPLWSTLDLW